MSNVLITGASSGIGKEFAREFAQRGFDLILVARSLDKLEELKQELKQDKQINVELFNIDLSLEGSPEKLYEYCKENNLDVSILVNNAGFGDFGKFSEGDLNKYKNMIDLNDKTLMTLTYLFIKDMKENRFGRIINVASIAAFMPGPFMAVYYASKAFVLSFSLALKEELKDDNIRFTVLCPGPVKTEFWDRAGVKMNSFKDKMLARTAKDVVKTAMKAFDNNKDVVVDGFINKAAVTASNIFGDRISAKTIAKVQSGLSVPKDQK